MAKHRTAERETALPDGISQQHLSDAGGLLRAILPIAILAGLLLAALLGVFGGTADPQVSAEGNGVTLTVGAPRTLRSGMILEIDILASTTRPIAKPVVTVSGSYLHGLSFNSIIPDASQASFEGGKVKLQYEPLKPGDRLQVKMDGQVNPPLIGENAGEIAVLDDDTVLVTRPVRLRVFP